MYSRKSRHGKPNLFVTGKNTYSVNIPVEISKKIFDRNRKRIPLYLHADGNQSASKALIHLAEIEKLIDAEDWEELIKYEQSLKPKVIKGEFRKVSLKTIWDDYVSEKKASWEASYLANDIHQATRIIESISSDIDNPTGILNDMLELTTIKQTKRYLKQISAAMTWAVRRKLISENPFPEIIKSLSTRKRDDETEINPFTKVERDLIIDTFRTGKYERFQGSHRQYADYVEFLFLTGVRTSEALGLRWKNCDFNKKTILLCEVKVLATNGKKDTEVNKIGLKTQKKRTIPMSPRVESLLFNRKNAFNSDNEQAVFDDIKHHAFRQCAWKQVLKNLGIEYRKPYQTRHTFITIMANESNLKLQQIASICGTSINVIVEHYLGCDTSEIMLEDL